MKYTKLYKGIFFKVSVIRQICNLHNLIRLIAKLKPTITYLSIKRNNEEWRYDEVGEFYTDYAISIPTLAHICVEFKKDTDSSSSEIDITWYDTSGTQVEVSSKYRETIDEIISAIEEHIDKEVNIIKYRKPSFQSQKIYECERKYKNIFFKLNTIRKASDLFDSLLVDSDAEPPTCKCAVERRGETWWYNDLEPFYTDYRSTDPQSVKIQRSQDANEFNLVCSKSEGSTVRISGKDRIQIQDLIALFDEQCDELNNVLKIELDSSKQPVIFIGHGPSNQWRELKDHLHDQHQYNVIAYETGARSGHSIRDILETMLTESSFAILVMTADDNTAHNKKRPRQNVVHEAGLFQGRLGFHRAIMVVEQGVELFSNVDGIQQIRFKEGNIKTTFGDVLAVIKREFEGKNQV